jgi:hypothetical protein
VGAAVDRLRAAYAAVPGDAIPRPPQRWSSLKPGPEELATPFGALFAAVRRESDDAVPDSLAASVRRVAATLGLALE